MSISSRLLALSLGLPFLPTGQMDKAIDLISISNDKKSFGTFYGSTTPSIGGLDANGVKEGQYVAYMTSWNVHQNHGGKKRQIMWFNRANGRSVVVSHDSNGNGADGDSFAPQIDPDGQTVAFESWATNLVPGDTNKSVDVFLWNKVTDQIKLVSQGSNGQSREASISRQGRYVAFTSSASTLTAGVDGTSTVNVYVKDMASGEIILLSKDPKTGKGVGGSNPSISEDGSRVAFYSYSNKLTPGDQNGLWDLFVWTRGSNELKRVSLTSTGQERNQGSESASRIVNPSLSGNGKYVAYATTATNVVPGDTNKSQDVFVTEIDTGRTHRVSTNNDNVEGNGDSPVGQGERIAISYDGSWVAFTSNAKNLGGGLILKNRMTGETQVFGQNTRYASGTPSISHSGKWIAFPSSEELDKRYKTSGIFAAKNPSAFP